MLCKIFLVFLSVYFFFVPLVSCMRLLVHEGVNFYPLRVRGGGCSGNFCPFTMWPWKLYLSIGLKKGETFPVQSPLITFRSEPNGKQRHCTSFHKVKYFSGLVFLKKITVMFSLCIYGIALFYCWAMYT